MTVVGEDDTTLVGCAHVAFDDDHRWGSLIDNLHITPHRRRTGIDTALLTCAAKPDAQRATGKSTYSSVLEQNTVAQQSYRTFGGTRIERPQCRPTRRTGPTQRLPQQAPLHLARRLIAGLHHRPRLLSPTGPQETVRSGQARSSNVYRCRIGTRWRSTWSYRTRPRLPNTNASARGNLQLWSGA
jgi:hypothetical protein